MTKRKHKVYIASPYSIGDAGDNVRLQMETYAELVQYGFAPMAPLWSHFQHIFKPETWETWMEIDEAWVKVSDFLLRIGGESKGADIEVAWAKENNIPVFYNTKDLIKHIWKIRKEDYQNQIKEID